MRVRNDYQVLVNREGFLVPVGYEPQHAGNCTKQRDRNVEQEYVAAGITPNRSSSNKATIPYHLVHWASKL